MLSLAVGVLLILAAIPAAVALGALTGYAALFVAGWWC